MTKDKASKHRELLDILTNQPNAMEKHLYSLGRGRQSVIGLCCEAHLGCSAVAGWDCEYFFLSPTKDVKAPEAARMGWMSPIQSILTMTLGRQGLSLAQRSTKQCQSSRSFLHVPPRNRDKVRLWISDWDKNKKLTGIDLGPFSLIWSPVAAALSRLQLDCQCCNTVGEGFWLDGFVLVL